jgi:hypothetical protein
MSSQETNFDFELSFPEVDNIPVCPCAPVSNPYLDDLSQIAIGLYGFQSYRTFLKIEITIAERP